jgi:NAD(P)-dependent dehydrogenase (short-subunit alcohol dehydrogenase family)
MSDKNKWTAADIPDQTGKTAVVTGANSGLGYETVRGLARKNARVIMACRNQEKGQAALAAVQAEFPQAELILMPLDLSNLTSVHAFGQAFTAQYNHLDILINNAGVMALPYQKTADGFEMQFGTNHLGHFALTGLLLDSLLNTAGSRVVTVSSGLHRSGEMDFDDLNWEKSYSKWGAYGRSKLANLLFAYELERKLKGAQQDMISVAAHPGYAATNLQSSGGSAIQRIGMSIMNKLLAQSAEMGALPQLYAATAPNVVGGDYYGPKGLQESRGYPVKVESNDKSHNLEDAAYLWNLSVEMTGVVYTQLDTKEEFHGSSTN